MPKNIKRIIFIIIICFFFIYNTSVMSLRANENIQSPSAILMEASTGTVVYEKNSDEKLHPASVTKIMTLLLIFEALEQGKIALNQEVVVSEHAASMGGSQVFLEAGEIQTVDTLIKCISVASANDASVAMAEHIWGSEEEFVAHMNQRAKELGMNNTNFVNCCGLDDDSHLTTARDIAIMSRELITKHPDIHNYSCIWMDTIIHKTARGESEFGLSNTNKLIKQYQWATGLKTGSTSKAGCCLSATANRNGIELIAVIMSAPNSKTRFADAISLLNYGYGVCNLYKDEITKDKYEVGIKCGIKNSVLGIADRDFTYLFIEPVNTADIEKHIELKEMEAPIEKGTVVGQVVYSIRDLIIGNVDILAIEEVRRIEYKDMLYRIFNIWCNFI